MEVYRHESIVVSHPKAARSGMHATLYIKDETSGVEIQIDYQGGNLTVKPVSGLAVLVKDVLGGPAVRFTTSVSI